MDGKNLLYSGDDDTERAKCEKWEKDGSHTMSFLPELRGKIKSQLFSADCALGPCVQLALSQHGHSHSTRSPLSVHEILDLLSRFGFNLPIVVIASSATGVPPLRCYKRQSGWHQDDFHTMWVRRIEKAEEEFQVSLDRAWE